ncbi:gamma-mobile-trio integrase GmtZ [Photobacterium alginatilyticum]|uniref:Integrase n=1 Tax=Photobacterium alginatilyticum TaxID=1775171 RepID=A0ABW9YKF5_9GAMM|nr:VPA1269 family protein [Photobacterium alginatilyticum]NBI54185.1 hypothetical protein [Photobacterium alginatilyticum]
MNELYETYKECKQSVLSLVPEEERTGSLYKLYQSLRAKDSRLPSSPGVQYKNEGWQSYSSLFDVEAPELYETYKECKQVVLSLVPEEEREGSLYKLYRSLRATDPRLPSHPDEQYKNVGWKGYPSLFDMTVINLYETYEECKQAVLHLVPEEDRKGNLEKLYQSLRAQNPKLPSTPAESYKNKGWQSYPSLFDAPYRLYETYEECKQAVLHLVPEEERTGSLEKLYQSLRAKDSKLPSTPAKSYKNKGWQSYSSLFDMTVINLYETYEECKQAVLHLVPEEERKDNLEKLYKSLRAKDPKLPASPASIYKNKGWQSYPSLFDMTVINLYETYEECKQAVLHLVPEEERKGNLKKLYQSLRAKNPKLPASPATIYNNMGWQSFDYLFDIKLCYSTLSAAREASLKILPSKRLTKADYALACRLDEKLPPNPESAYFCEWRTWEHYLGQSDGYYPTINEASEAAQKMARRLNINLSHKTYSKFAIHDPRLPENPKETYKSDWQNWPEFCGTRTKDLYRTIEAAQSAALEHGLETKALYDEKRFLDARLPAEPARYYGVKSYAEFIGFEYWGVKKVRAYCHKHQISTLIEYQKHAKTHSHLKSKVSLIDGYQRKEDILYKRTKFDSIIEAGFSDWGELGLTWTKRGKNLDSKRGILSRFLEFLILRNALPTEVCTFFDKKHQVPELDDFIETLALSSRTAATSNIIVSFFSSAFEKYCFDVDPETGEKTPIDETLFRNPYQLSKYTGEERDRPTESVKPPLDYLYMHRAREYLAPEFITDKSKSQIKCRNFGQLGNAQAFYNQDWFEVDESLIDRNDPNCVWKKDSRYKHGSGREKVTVYKIWSPVRAIAMYVLFSLPLRGIQVTYLDSGEADDYKLVEDGNELKWELNDNPLAGQLDGRGILHKEPNGTVGMLVSTNKTSAKQGGYSVPYMPDDVARWLIRLRDWQSKYNPLTEPTAWSDIKHPRKIDDKILLKRGRQCFLFRDPLDSAIRKNNPVGSQPLSTTSAFKLPLPKLLYSIQDEHFPLATKTGSGDAFVKYTSVYTPHSTRVSQITALIFDAKVDPRVVAKLVGHANIVMTIYYAKARQSYIRDELADGYKRLLAKAPERIKQLIIDKKIAEAKGELIFMSGESNPLLSDNWPTASIRFMDWGLCPVAAAQCKEGGAPLERNKGQKQIYQPVPAGFLGASNCFQCRFLVTGPAYIGGLITKFQEINISKVAAQSQMDSLREQEDELDNAQYNARSESLPVEDIELSLSSVHQALDMEETRLHTLVTDQIAIARLMNDCTELMNQQIENTDGDGLSLVVNRPHGSVSVEIEECSEFRMLGEVCENADIFLSGNDSAAIARRSQLLDKMLMNNNLPVGLFAMSEKQQRYVGNQMQKLLLERLNGWGAVEQLMEGRLHLDDLIAGSEESLQSLGTAFKQLITAARKAERLTRGVENE